ncbi:aryl-sulfate sulfotransferase [Sphingobacterium cellulitidis]|uniref:aryl-sulfate sulfotransferase n=1 Tax=Sphingobacterium cellulitidis TaxID=1768011 RepID=UPI003C7B856C
MKSKIFVFLFLIVVAAFGGYYYFSRKVQILEIELSSPDNQSIKEDVAVKLNSAAPIYIEYWKEGESQKFKSPISKEKESHLVHLLLLEPSTKYQYQIVIDQLFPVRSKLMSFETREQSPWMVHNWIKENNPHDPKAMGDDLVLLCYRGYPGNISIVDGNGTVRWYWQDEKLGVRLASLTPRGTILALLAPANKDEFKKEPEKKEGKSLPKNYYLRSGRLGFMGGTQLVEISQTGKVLWRSNLADKGIIMHHDVQMNDLNEIYAIVRDYKIDDRPNLTKDTLWGDAIVRIDSLGNIKNKWTPWKDWDLTKDHRLDSFKHDRFHFNTISFDQEGNYITSSPIENQVWKIDPKSGKIIWKLGKNGDFKMDAKDYFYFQHMPYITKEGDLLLFDNGDYAPQDTAKLQKRSRAIAFKLNEKEMTAKQSYQAPLPIKQYTARMGSAFLLSNGNLLQTSSKTGSAIITDKSGKVLWELNSHFIPYRAVQVPESFWKNYILKSN